LISSSSITWSNISIINKETTKAEIERIKQQELELIYESAGVKKEKVVEKPKDTPVKENVSTYEWNELTKKSAKFNVDDPKLHEFYEDDQHKRGLGIKPNISFRTNPYDIAANESLQKLDGVNVNNIPKKINSNITESNEIDNKTIKAERQK